MVILFFVLQIIILIIDQLSKIWAVNTLANGTVLPFIPGVLEFSYLENRGIAFGMFQNSYFIMAILTGIVLIGLCVAVLKWKVKNKLFTISMAMIVGGGFGNLIDRIFRKFVVDFLHTTFMDFPTFNFADCMVCLGVGLLFLYILFFDDEEDGILTGKKKNETT